MKSANMSVRARSAIASPRVLAVAVASAFTLPTAADAQTSNIQIYGRANVSVERVSVDANNNPLVEDSDINQVVDNASRVGVRGKEELGQGLAAIFQIESAARIDDGSGGVWASRDSFVGLESGLGTLRLGRTIGPVYYATYDYISLHNHDTGNSADVLLAPAIFGNVGRMNNVIWYTSPRYSGFSVEGAYSFLAEDPAAVAPGNTNKPYYAGVVGLYDQGPLHAALSYAQTKNTNVISAVTGELNDDRAYTIGGLYDFKAFVVGLLFERAESDLAGGADVKRNYYRGSLMVPVGPHEFHLNYGYADHRLDADLEDDGAAQWTIAYNYNFSKRTKIYGFYTMVDNKDNGNYGFVSGLASRVGVDQSSIALGIRHNF